MFVPPSAVVQSTERTFVARIKEGTIEQVPVTRGLLQGDLVEVFGELHEGDDVVKRASEELRPGGRVNARGAAGPAGSASGR